MAGFVKSIEEVPEVDLPSNQNEVENTIVTEDDTKKKTKVADRNHSAMASFTIFLKLAR